MSSLTQKEIQGNKVQTWVIWATLTGLYIFYPIQLRGGLPLHFESPNVTLDGLFISSIIILAVSILVRWILLPKMKNIFACKGCFILGLAFANTLGYFAIFLFTNRTTDQTVIWILGFLGMLQFFPYPILFRPPFNEVNAPL